MKRALLAALLAGIALSASAAQRDLRSDLIASDADVTIKMNETCPGGYFESVPSYGLQGGHLAQKGWLCESLHKDKGE